MSVPLWEIDMISLGWQIKFLSLQEWVLDKAHSKLARAASWRLTEDSQAGLSHVSTPNLYIPVCWMSKNLPFYFWISVKNIEKTVEFTRSSWDLEKLKYLAGISQNQAWQPGCMPFQSLLSRPGILHTECRKLPQNCHLENLIISVVSWKNRNAGLYFFVCIVFSNVLHFIRGHVRVYSLVMSMLV